MEEWQRADVGPARERAAAVVTPPLPSSSASCPTSPLTKLRVSWASTKEVIFFERKMDACKIPSDAVAPLGHGEHIETQLHTLEPVDAVAVDGHRPWCPIIPPQERFELLAAAATPSEELDEAAEENRAILRQLNDTRMAILISRRQGASKRAALPDDDDDDDEPEMCQPPAKRPALLPSIGNCNGCQRPLCLCVRPVHQP